jgi:acyl-CoA oxidase
VLELLVARGLLGDFKRQFADSRIGGFLRVLARRTTTAITQRNPIIARLSGLEHLRDAETQLDLLTARRDQLLDSVAGRISSRIGDGIEPFEAVNQCQSHLLDLARAETALWIFEQARAVQNAPPIWDAIVDLYGLSTIEDDLAWFMTHGYVEPNRAEGIRDAVNALCATLRPHAIALVDAFDIDDHRLGAPIGRRA